MTDHLVATSDKDGDRSCVSTFLDYEHLIPGGTEGKFTNDSSFPELLRSEVFESGNDSAVGGDSDELNVKIERLTH